MAVSPILWLIAGKLWVFGGLFPCLKVSNILVKKILI